MIDEIEELAAALQAAEENVIAVNLDINVQNATAYVDEANDELV